MSMSKKQAFLHNEQSRDKHPEKRMKGSAADLTARGTARGNVADHHQQPGAGKVENDHNKQGAQAKTQTNQHERTPESRHDREALVGSHNQSSSRKGGGAGRTTRGAG